VLDAAAELFRRHGIDDVTMDDVAAAAGVGKGTLYRGFGDKSGLARALLGERERELQEAVLTGPPPLGHGAPPADRLAAFLGAYAELLAVDAELVDVAETATAGARFESGAYAFWRAHVASLLRAASAAPSPTAADELTAELLLGSVSASLYRHLRRDGHDHAAIVAALRGLAASVLPPGRAPGRR
jgi:AcrR family transcriptional regulator